MEGPLFNAGFLGGKFLWFVGQVADDSTWRENLNPAKNKDPKKDVPGWGYRYKVRVMGCHDQDEEELVSEDLPWAQVMYPVTAGSGMGGSRQTPAIRQGMFVYGFFLDGQDQQSPIIMGVLGSNAKTVVKDLKTGKTGGKNFAPQSGFANADEDETKVTPDEQIATVDPSSVGTLESTDNIHQETVEDRRKNDVLEQKHALSCADPLHQSDVKNLQTCTEELSKNIQNLQRAQQDYASAVSLPVIGVDAEVQGLIDNAAGEMSGQMKETMGKAEQFTNEQFNKDMAPLLNLAVPSFKNVLMEEQIKGFEEICCAFNAINAGLAGLIGAALAKSFANKKKQSPPASAAVGPQPAQLDTPVEIPPLPPEGFYSPSPICSTEELIGEVLGGTINKITSTFTSAKNRVVSTANDGTNPDIATAAGSAPTQSVDMSISKSNVAASLKSGALVGGIAGALAGAAGVNPNIIGSVTNAFKAGNYSSGLASMLSLSGVSSDSGVVTAAIHAIDSGDLVGGFTEAAGALGVPVGMMAGMGGAFSAIQSGDMSALTGQIQSLASFDPQSMLGSVAGMAPGDLMGGMGAMGGMNMDIASSMNFTQSITQFFDCDQEPECSPNDVHTLGGGGESVDGASCASIAESANNAAGST